MIIDKELVMKEFNSYVSKYNMADTKISLKASHTYRVASLCEQIAKSLNLSETDCDIARCCGMLHDIGRFEQVRIYKTFFDSLSVDHAQFGADLLFKENLYEIFVPKKMPANYSQTESVQYLEEYNSIRNLIEKAIRVHNVFILPEELSEREKLFATILRDADKIDILKVNCETPLEEVYNVTTEELLNAEVSEDTRKAFMERRCAKRSDRTTAADYIVGHICFIYELVYPKSTELMYSQGYLKKLLDFKSDNPKTKEWFEFMKKELNF